MARTIIHTDLKAHFGDKDHLEVSQTKSFAELIFEMLSETEPTSDEAKLFELILNLSIDHGIDTPSAKEVIRVKGEGKSLQESVAAGILEIGDVHGGAAEPLMEILNKIQSADLKIQKVVSDYLSEDKKIPGFGHRIYKDEDPRSTIIFEELKKRGIGGDYLMIIVELQNEIENQTGKRLPINIDGAIAVALCGLGWKPVLGKAVFIIARTPGLVAHSLNNS